MYEIVLYVAAFTRAVPQSTSVDQCAGSAYWLDTSELGEIATTSPSTLVPAMSACVTHVPCSSCARERVAHSTSAREAEATGTHWGAQQRQVPRRTCARAPRAHRQPLSRHRYVRAGRRNCESTPHEGQGGNGECASPHGWLKRWRRSAKREFPTQNYPFPQPRLRRGTTFRVTR